MENQKLVQTTAIKADYRPLERILCPGAFIVHDILCNVSSWLLASRNSYNVKHELFYTEDYLPEYSNFECQNLDTIVQLECTQTRNIAIANDILSCFSNLEIL